MFPSSDNNPFFQFPQHLSISSSSFGQANSNFINETLFHHQNQIQNQVFDDGRKQENCLLPNNLFDDPTKVELLASENINEYEEMKNQYAPLDIIPARLQPPGKKDRHSKIVTAQGPRDRRVRLSIDIAKKFFGLQDMLGYDKASKTLDWLLTKSKMAIEEVAQSKKKNTHMANFASSEINDPEMMMMINNQGKMSAKESNRVKARERARERTRRKKMCLLADHTTTISPSTSNSNQSLPVTQKGACKISDVDFDMNCQVYSNLCPQISSYKELSQIKKNKFISTTSSMYDGPSKNSCPEDHCFPCTSTANWDSTSTQRVFQLCGLTNWDMKSTNHHL